MAQPQVPPSPPVSTALAIPLPPPPPPSTPAPKVPPPSPLSIALATAGIIDDEVVPEKDQNQILDLTTNSVPSTSSTPPTPYQIYMKKKEKLEQRLSKQPQVIPPTQQGAGPTQLHEEVKTSEINWPAMRTQIIGVEVSPEHARMLHRYLMPERDLLPRVGFLPPLRLHTVVNQLRVGYRAVNELAILPFTIPNAIGWMLHSPIDTYILPHGVQAIPTYLEFLLPLGTYARIATVPGVVNPLLMLGERFILCGDKNPPNVVLYNWGKEVVHIKRGSYIAQLMFCEIPIMYTPLSAPRPAKRRKTK